MSPLHTCVGDGEQRGTCVVREGRLHLQGNAEQDAGVTAMRPDSVGTQLGPQCRAHEQGCVHLCM